MTIDLTGKVALISGGSRGIGRGIALEMGRSGANVTVNCRTHPHEAEEVATEIREAGADALVYPADVSDRGAVDAMVNATVEKFGRIDIVVSNAFYSKREPFLDLEIEGAEHHALSSVAHQREQAAAGYGRDGVDRPSRFRTCTLCCPVVSHLLHLPRQASVDIQQTTQHGVDLFHAEPIVYFDPRHDETRHDAVP